MLLLLLTLLAGLPVGRARAQALTQPLPAALPVARNLLPAYAKGTRSASGQPGPNYWQNTAAYTLDIRFDPDTRRVAGTVEIDYRNNSPDTLKQLWFKLFPNLYQKGAPRGSRFDPTDVGDGVTIERLTLNGTLVPPEKRRAQATQLVVPVPGGLLPRQSISVSVTYAYILNAGSPQRTGQVEPGAAFVAYFFPRIAVYDDLEGWDRNLYIGDQEFYNDFCTFTAAITVPRHYVVWATGDLTNADQVLAKPYVRRLRQAETKDGITTIIDTTDLRRRAITAPNNLNTWRFEARDVTDFVFATADHYVWQATSLVVDPATKRRTRVEAVYNPKHNDYAEVVQFARKTVEAMSYTFPKWPFPYAHETVFDGLDQMEYPMMVNDNPMENRNDVITLTDHEIFHTMFPFYMGINETKYAWMDEGWATIGEWLISPLIEPTLRDDYGVAPYTRRAGTEIDVPIMTLTTQLGTGGAVGLNSYFKPAFAYYYLKDMLGDALFTKALHTYIGNWHGKHPMPHDFFNAMNAGAGQNLNWFWQRWFFDGGVPDLAIGEVKQVGATYQIVVESKGTKPVPVDLTVTFADNTTQQLHRTAAVWATGARTVTVAVPTTQAIRQVTLGSFYVIDTHPADNQWPRP